MKRFFRIFFLFSRNSLKTTLMHRTGIILFTLGKTLRFAMFFAFVFFLVHKTQTLAGYAPSQIIIFFLTFTIIDTVSQLFFREVYRFRPLVLSGELDTILVKPYHPFMRILIGGIDVMDAVMIIPYTGLLVVALFQVGNITPISGVFYFLLIVNALVLATGFHMLVLALGVLTTEIDHAIMIYRDVTRLGGMPIDIYREPIRFTFTFILPVGIMMSFPVKALFNLLSPSFIFVSFLFGISTLFAGLCGWEYAIKKYQSWGG